MSGGVVDGQAVSAAVTNPAFIEKNADDGTVHKLFLHDTDILSGPILFDNIQRALNTLMTASGSTETTPGTTYGATGSTINDGDSYETALTKLADKFDPVSGGAGHTHDGTAGQGPILEFGRWHEVSFPQQTLADNTSSPTLITAFLSAVVCQAYVDYTLTRASGEVRAGRLTLTQDGSGSTGTSILNDDSEELADCGVTFSTTVETVLSQQAMTLKYTTTSTGTDAKFLCKLTEKVFPT